MAEQEIDQLRDDAARQREAIAVDLEYVGDRVSPGRIVERRRAVVVKRLGGVRNSVFGSPEPRHSSGTMADDSGDSLGDKASGAVDSLNEKTPDSVSGFAEGNPLAAGLIGLGVGLLAATLIPETREEHKIADQAQGHLDSLAGDLGQGGRQAADNLKPAAQDAAQNVKGSAQDSAQSVKSDGQDAANAVKDKAKDQRDQVQS